MKKLVLTALSFFFVGQLFAQNIETSFALHTGLMHFAGPSATSSTAINKGFTNTSTLNYTNNPYGSKTEFGFGIDLQAQLVTKKQFIAGLQIGTEILKSKVDITEINSGSLPFPSKAEGSTNINNHYINLNPYIGYRLPLPKVKLDILTGIEFGYITNSYERGSAKADNGATYKTQRDRKTVSVDNRVKFGLSAHYDRVGLTASYAHGLTNYLGSMIGGTNPSAHTEVIRIGVSLLIFNDND
jgi:hypothetical protein